MNVYDQAHGLASAIKESEEFKQYNALKNRSTRMKNFLRCSRIFRQSSWNFRLSR